MSVESSPRYCSASSGVSAGADTVATIAAVSAPKIGWLTTVLLCLVAAVLLLLNGYVGYFGVVLAVGIAAAVNLT
jgi:membrane-bound ClpP family serine protease